MKPSLNVSGLSSSLSVLVPHVGSRRTGRPERGVGSTVELCPQGGRPGGPIRVETVLVSGRGTVSIRP